MTKSPARSSSRRSASARSCGRRSPGASSRTRRITPSCNWRRLAQAMQIASMAVADGDVKAIPALLKVLDRVDRYQRAAKVSEVYDDEARKRLFDKINRVAANLGLDEPRTAIEGPAEGPDSAAATGPPTRKKKWRGGSAQAFEKARFGEGNASFSLAQFWPGFAGFGSNFARFGFSLDFIWAARCAV